MSVALILRVQHYRRDNATLEPQTGQTAYVSVQTWLWWYFGNTIELNELWDNTQLWQAAGGDVDLRGKSKNWLDFRHQETLRRLF